MKDAICINFFVKRFFLVEHRWNRPRIHVKRPKKNTLHKKINKNFILHFFKYFSLLILLIFTATLFPLFIIFFLFFFQFFLTWNILWSFYLQSLILSPADHPKNTPNKKTKKIFIFQFLINLSLSFHFSYANTLYATFI